MSISATLEGLDALEQKLSRLPSRVEAGVKVTGKAVDYALVWEWGRIDVKPGPKTLYSTNPAGQTRVLTITAPHGWIRVNRQRYQDILREEAANMKLGSKNAAQWKQSAIDAVENTAARSTEIMIVTAPIDKGLLHNSLEVVQNGDPLLDQAGSELSIEL